MGDGKSESAILREAARRAVGAHLNVQWSDASVPGLAEEVRGRTDAYQQLASSIPAVNTGDLPSLIFVISDELKPKSNPSSKDVPTLERRASEAAWIELFQTEGDYSVFIPGRFFNIIRVDTTGVTDDHNKYLSSKTAPVVLLTGKDGQVSQVFDSQAKIKRNGVVAGMCKILRDDGLVSNMKPFAQLHDLMKQLQQAEIDLLKLAKVLKDLNTQLAGKEADDLSTARRKKEPVKTSLGTQLARGRVSDFEATKLFDGKMAKYTVLDGEYVLLQELGLPQSKMPPQPTKPAVPGGAASSGSGASY